jgi:hypothetical protein
MRDVGELRHELQRLKQFHDELKAAAAEDDRQMVPHFGRIRHAIHTVETRVVQIENELRHLARDLKK